jgi:hypothetical protein
MRISRVTSRAGGRLYVTAPFWCAWLGRCRLLAWYAFASVMENGPGGKEGRTEDEAEEADAGLDERRGIGRAAGPNPTDHTLWARSAHSARRTPASARTLVKYCPDLHSPVELLVQNHVMF